MQKDLEILKCPNHGEKNVSWMCIEQNCNQRLMCSFCAVKVHAKEHQLQEFESIFQKGLINIFYENDRKVSTTDSTQLESVNQGEGIVQSSNIEMELRDILSVFENQISKVLQNFQSLETEIQQSHINQVQLRKNEKEDALREVLETENLLQNMRDSGANSSKQLSGSVSSQISSSVSSMPLQNSALSENNGVLKKQNQPSVKKQVKFMIDQETVQANSEDIVDNENEINKTQVDENEYNIVECNQQPEGQDQQEDEQYNEESQVPDCGVESEEDNTHISSEQSIENMEQYSQTNPEITSEINEVKNENEEEGDQQESKELEPEQPHNPNHIKEKLEKSIQTIYSKLLNEARIQEKRDLLDNLNKQCELLKQLKNCFFQMTSMFLDNQYTTDLCSLFEIQLQLLQKNQKNPNITNQNQFFEFISNQWRLDSEQMTNQFNKSMSTLSQALRKSLSAESSIVSGGAITHIPVHMNLQPVYSPTTINIPQQPIYSSPGQDCQVSLVSSSLAPTSHRVIQNNERQVLSSHNRIPTPSNPLNCISNNQIIGGTTNTNNSGTKNHVNVGVGVIHQQQGQNLTVFEYNHNTLTVTTQNTTNGVVTNIPSINQTSTQMTPHQGTVSNHNNHFNMGGGNQNISPSPHMYLSPSPAHNNPSSSANTPAGMKNDQIGGANNRNYKLFTTTQIQQPNHHYLPNQTQIPQTNVGTGTGAGACSSEFLNYVQKTNIGVTSGHITNLQNNNGVTNTNFQRVVMVPVENGEAGNYIHQQNINFHKGANRQLSPNPNPYGKRDFPITSEFQSPIKVFPRRN